ncbi:MAG: hypothetical protein IT558_06220 [Alphaproteobacteria bacterium]|nr:hypothetical protein [Alphaproteobacteria bacterium]
MRLFIFLILALLPLPVLACEEFDHAMNDLEMQVAHNAVPSLEAAPFLAQAASKDELEKWAQNSTLGGGRVEPVNFAGRELLIAYRSYTSGVKSSDASVYAKHKDKWILVKSIPPVHNSWIEASVIDGKLVFRPETGRESLAVLSPHNLPE